MNIRNRKTVDWISTEIGAYKKFKKNNKSINVDSKTWRKINIMFFDMARDYMLETGDFFKFPGGVGTFCINKNFRKKFRKDGTINLPVDWVKSQKAGKTIYNLNTHTEGYFFGWLWDRRNCGLKNAQYFYFKPSRETSRLIAKYIKKDPNQQHKYLIRKNTRA